MKNLAIVLSLLFTSTVFAGVNFQSCEHFDSKGEVATALSMKILSIDSKVQEVFGDLNGCPRQILMYDSLVYTLSVTSSYACVYGTNYQRVGVPQFQCYKK